MFTDSKVAELFLYGKAKSRYFIMYDLKRNPKILSFMVLPQCLQDKVEARPYHVISYNESFNRALHFGQMDFLTSF